MDSTMLKKRLIFTLLYDNGNFMLSRNFRLQKVGNIEWLKVNYDFSHISYSIDELVVLDVSRSERNVDAFCLSLKSLTDGCFVPITAGGGVSTIDSARKLLRSGADKIMLNTELYAGAKFPLEMASEFGQQCVVASLDIKLENQDEYKVWSKSGSVCEPESAKNWIESIANFSVGELYLNSVDRDGTGQGFDMKLLDLLPVDISKPVILAGGAGNATHLLEGLADSRVDAVATANLFNFVGDGLKTARNSLVKDGVVLPMWDVQVLENHLNLEKAHE
jgi:cyclase